MSLTIKGVTKSWSSYLYIEKLQKIAQYGVAIQDYLSHPSLSQAELVKLLWQLSGSLGSLGSSTGAIVQPHQHYIPTRIGITLEWLLHLLIRYRGYQYRNFVNLGSIVIPVQRHATNNVVSSPCSEAQHRLGWSHYIVSWDVSPLPCVVILICSMSSTHPLPVLQLRRVVSS